MPPRQKIFDLEEANTLIPRLETMLKEFEEGHDDFKRLQDELLFEELLADTVPSSEMESRWQTLENHLLKLARQIGKILGLGCLLRHPEKGMVDFLSRKKDGEWICYCWRRGEKAIQYYHTLHGGFFERRPVGLV